MSLTVTLGGSPPQIRIARNGGVPQELWAQLGRNIAPLRAKLQSAELFVPIEDFLAAKNWLGDALMRYNCDVDLAPAVGALLEREHAERREIAGLLAGSFIASPLDTLPCDLVGRFDLRELKWFQRRDLNRILSLSNGANFSVPGAGKTAVGYACYEAERVKGRVERLLVVAPLSAFDAWTDEPTRWMNPQPRISWLDGHIPRHCEVLLVNYQRLASRYEQIATWVQERPCHVILDEAHRIKRGRPGEWGSTCLDLAHLAARRDILTGTPAPQHPSDFVALLDFLWPRQAARILPRAALATNPSSDAMARVSKDLRPLFARTTKGELGLRKPKLRVEYVKMKALQTQIYQAVRGRMQQLVLSPRERLQLAQLNDVTMYLIEAASNPALLATALGRPDAARTAWPPAPVPPHSSLVQQIQNYAAHEVPAKFEKLATMVAANAKRGRKTLVWSNFVANLQDLATRVLAPYNPALVYGQIPSSRRETEYITREKEIHRFRHDDDCMVLLANPAAMSEGISLHKECHDAIYADRTFNAGQYLQSIDRIHRLGLRDDVDTRITFLVSRGTIDEVIDRRVHLKADRLSQMLDDPHLLVMALPELDDYGEWVETGDLDLLFGHLTADP